MIWQTWTIEPHTVEDLSVDARLLLGIITTCDDCSIGTMVDICFSDRKRVRKLLREIQKSKHKTIIGVLKHGLPLDCAVAIPKRDRPLRCKTCEQRLASFPCAACAMVRQLDLSLSDEDPLVNIGDLPASKKPTDRQPGTAEKIAVMKQRAEDGYGVFCPGDLTFIEDESD